MEDQNQHSKLFPNLPCFETSLKKVMIFKENFNICWAGLFLMCNRLHVPCTSKSKTVLVQRWKKETTLHKWTTSVFIGAFPVSQFSSLCLFSVSRLMMHVKMFQTERRDLKGKEGHAVGNVNFEVYQGYSHYIVRHLNCGGEFSG